MLHICVPLGDENLKIDKNEYIQIATTVLFIFVLKYCHIYYLYMTVH